MIGIDQHAPSKRSLFSALLLTINRGDVGAVATGEEVIRVSWPICDLVAWCSVSLVHQLRIFGSSINRWRTPRPQIDRRAFIVGPHDCLTSLNYVLRRKRSVRERRQSFNGAEEFARFRWNDPVPCIIIWTGLAVRSVAKASAC